jgi:hypothetical protein
MKKQIRMGAKLTKLINTKSTNQNESFFQKKVCLAPEN